MNLPDIIRVHIDNYAAEIQLRTLQTCRERTFGKYCGTWQIPEMNILKIFIGLVCTS